MKTQHPFFGLTHKGYNNLTTSLGSSGAKKYMYNGKLKRSGNPAFAGELQQDFDLDWYNYGARFYDAGLGRWFVPDPLAEKYDSWTPYQYVRNNPIHRIDPNGMWDEAWSGMEMGDPPDDPPKHKTDNQSENKQDPIDKQFWDAIGSYKYNDMGFLTYRRHDYVHIEANKTGKEKLKEGSTGEGGYDGSLIFGKTWVEYMSGRTEVLTVKVSSLNLSHLSQSDLASDGSVNLTNLKIFGIYAFTGTSLALGNITLVSQGKNMFSIKDDVYDFDIRANEGWSFRNIATGIAGILHGGVYNNIRFINQGSNIPTYVPGFRIHFEGSVYIKP